MSTEKTDDTTPQVPAIGDSDFVPMPHADDAELTEIREALAKSEDKPVETPVASPEPKEQAAAPVATPETPAAATPPEEPTPTAKPTQPVPSIPKPRVDEMIARAEERATQRTLEILGKLGVKLPGQPDVAESPQPTAEQQIEALEAQKLKLAEQYDAGEIASAAAWRSAEAGIDRRIRSLTAQMMAPAPRAAPEEDLFFETEQAKIIADNPVVEKITAAQAEALVPFAYQEAERRGIEIRPGRRGDIQLRGLVAEMATRVYAPLLGIARPQDKPSPAPTPDAKTIAANQQKVAKLQTLPPSLHEVSSGRGAAPGEQWTDEKIASMDIEDITAAIPQSVRARLVGLTR